MKIPLRFAQWWSHLIPPVLVFAYLLVYYAGTDAVEGLIKILIFLPVVLGSAAFGYVLNDLTDLKEDAAVGKLNSMQDLSILQRGFVVLGLLAIVGLPWLYLPINKWNITFLMLQFVAYILYSVKPIRLKERGVLGLLNDTFYGHINPVLVTIFTFYEGGFEWFELWLASLVLMLLIKGSRNILLHQVDDRKKDRITNTRTFVANRGGLFTINFINKIVLPIEASFILINVVWFSIFLPYYYLGLVLFIVWVYYKYSIWKLPVLPYRQQKFKLLYFFNDWYEEWMPLALLILILIINTAYWPLLVLHLLLFPKLFVNLVADIKTIGKSIVDKE